MGKLEAIYAALCAATVQMTLNRWGATRLSTFISLQHPSCHSCEALKKDIRQGSAEIKPAEPAVFTRINRNFAPKKNGFRHFTNFFHTYQAKL